MATTKQLLEIARRRIRTGWVQGTLGAYTSRTGPVCLIGGLFAGLYELGLIDKGGSYRTPEAKELRDQAERLLIQCLPRPWKGIAEFNDYSLTKHEDVVKVVECAVKRAPDRPSVVV